MIKFVGEDDNTGRKIFGFGLSALNIQLLREGLPISINGEEMGLPGEVLIFYGRTEEIMFRELKKVGLVHPLLDIRTHKDKQT